MSFHPNINNTKGFSVIEMSLVLVIMGIFMAMVVPQFSHFMKSSRLSGSSNELMTDLHHARSMAVKKNKTFRVEFNVDEYRVIEVGSGDVIRTRTLPKGVNCAATGNPNFYAWGIADAVDISLTGETGTKNLTLLSNGNVSHN